MAVLFAAQPANKPCQLDRFLRPRAVTIISIPKLCQLDRFLRPRAVTIINFQRRDGELQYRTKSRAEEHERIAFESELKQANQSAVAHTVSRISWRHAVHW
jgi:hypothetical protein